MSSSFLPAHFSSLQEANKANGLAGLSVLELSRPGWLGLAWEGPCIYNSSTAVSCSVDRYQGSGGGAVSGVDVEDMTAASLCNWIRRHGLIQP